MAVPEPGFNNSNSGKDVFIFELVTDRLQTDTLGMYSCMLKSRISSSRISSAISSLLCGWMNEYEWGGSLTSFPVKYPRANGYM